jgi:hypothetical protein
MSIKLAKAQKLADIGKYGNTWSEVKAVLPEYLIKTCTSKQIAVIMDAMYHQHVRGKLAAGGE